MQPLPKTIFKYEPFSLRALQNLKRQSVYFGSPKGFNDPYDSALHASVRELVDSEVPELLELVEKDKDSPLGLVGHLKSLPATEAVKQLEAGIREHVDNYRDEFLAKRGVTCFSECNDNLLMWSHYGGHHKGFCLEFRTSHEPFNKLRRVGYAETIPKIDPFGFLSGSGHEQILNLLCTKSSDWSYEKEWRALHGEAGTVYTYDEKALKAVYFGTEIDVQDRDMICLILSEQNQNVRFYCGFRSETDFNVSFQRFEYLSLIHI